MSRYRPLRTIGTGPDGPVEEVAAERLGAGTLARRRAPVPAGPRRHRLRDLSETLARVGHPAIATVVDLVDVDETSIEVLTELGAECLADRVARGPLPLHEARSLLRTLAEALAAAHGAGVAHGHVAESNVVLRDGAPLLTDFGLTEARTGRPEAHPFRTDVRDLAALGLRLLDATVGDPGAPALPRTLAWVADDPDATLQDLRRALDDDRPAPPPPPPPPVVRDGPLDPVENRARPAWVLAGVAVLFMGLLGGAATVLVPGATSTAEDHVAAMPAAPRPCPPVRTGLAADVDGDGCDDPVDWRQGEAELTYTAAGGELLRFRVGRPGDDLVLGDWDCDGTATAAVVRAATGETFVFDSWAAEGETLVADPGPALAPGSPATVVDDGGCDRLRSEGS